MKKEKVAERTKIIIMKKLFLILLTICLAGCKETHCPSFPPGLVDYFPYTKGEELKFKNQSNDTLMLIINDRYATDSYNLDCKCPCGADFRFETDVSSSFSLKIIGDISISERHILITCDFDHNDVFFYSKEGINPFNVEQQLTLPDTIILENHVFNRIGYIKIIRGEGIVEFWDKEQNGYWVKIE